MVTQRTHFQASVYALLYPSELRRLAERVTAGVYPLQMSERADALIAKMADPNADLEALHAQLVDFNADVDCYLDPACAS